MRAFFITAGSVVTAGALFLALSIVLGAGKPFPDPFYGSREITLMKREYAFSIDRPKLIVMAGSGAMFGVRASMLEQATGRPTVNMGVTGSLGIRFMAREVRLVAKPGDVVVLPLEPHVLATDEVENFVSATVAYSMGLDLMQDMRPLEAIHFLRLLPLPRILRAAWTEIQPGELAVSHKPGDIDQRGDWRGPTASLTDNLIVLAGAQPNETLQPPPSPKCERQRSDYRSLEIIEELATWAEDEGVSLIMTWPNQMNRPEVRQSAYICRLFAARNRLTSSGIKWIGDYEDSLLPMSLMFDTLYHPTGVGADVRTARLVDALCSETTLCN
jgi:hypothetical protein